MQRSIIKLIKAISPNDGHGDKLSVKVDEFFAEWKKCDIKFVKEQGFAGMVGQDCVYLSSNQLDYVIGLVGCFEMFDMGANVKEWESMEDEN